MEFCISDQTSGSAGGPRGRLERILREFKRRVWGAPAVYLAGSVLARVGSFVLLPLYTRRLDPSQYGDYTLALSIQAGVQTLLSGLFLAGISRLFFDGATRADGKVRAGIVARWFVLIAAVSTAALVMLAQLLGSPEPGLAGRYELTLLAVGGCGAALAAVPYLVMRVSQRPLAASLFNMGQFLATSISGIVLVAVFGRGVTGAIEAMSISGALNGLIAVAFIFGSFGGPMPRSPLRDALRFTVPLLPATVEAYVRTIADRWLLKYFGLDSQLGEYGLANQLMTPASMVVSAWNDAEGPRVGEVFRDRGLLGLAKEQRALEKSYLLSAVGPALFITLCAPLLGMVVGKDFSNALILLPFVGLVLVLDTLYSPPLYVVYYASRTKLISVITISTSALNVVLNLVLIPRFAVAGAIVARLVASALRLAFIRWAARRCIRQELKRAPDQSATIQRA